MAKTGMNPGVEIRRARQEDAARIAELSTQLGYPATAKEIAERLRRLVPASQHAAFVAKSAEDDVIGWLHVSVQPLLEVELRAEVHGLVVGEGQRSFGAGWRLLEEAERWAKKRGCRSINLRCNVIRERAHLFYERHGYEHYKTQKAFRKSL